MLKRAFYAANVEGIFEVVQGVYDGAEVVELTGLKILAEISEKISEINFGLYRDDMMGVLKSGNGPQTEKMKKLFKNISRKMV